MSVVREGDVEFGDGDGLDLVVGLGDGAFDRLLVIVGEDGRHCGGVRRYERVLGRVLVSGKPSERCQYIDGLSGYMSNVEASKADVVDRLEEHRTGCGLEVDVRRAVCQDFRS